MNRLFVLVPIAGLALASSGPTPSPTPANFTVSKPLLKSGSNVTALPATSTDAGFLTAADWNTFNNKQAPMSPAANGVAGYVTAATQEVSGRKTFLDYAQSDIFYSVLVQPLTDGQNVRLMGRRAPGDDTNIAADVELGPEHTRTSGYVLQIDNPIFTPVAGLTWDGIFFSGNKDGKAAFFDANPNSNHISLQARDGNEAVIQGAQGYILVHQADGGGFPDGGGNMPYAGHHGDVILTSRYPRDAGWGVTYNNAASAGDPVLWGIVAFDGAMFNFSQRSRGQFERCPEVNTASADGQFFYGDPESSLMYATDSHRWYYCDGTSWVMVPTKAEVPVFFPPVLVNAPLTVATLGGFRIAHVLTLQAANYYLSVAGTGGSTNVNVRVSNGVLNCDFTFACNEGTGARRAAGSGSGCTGFAGADSLSVSVTSLGDCATPPTMLGNLTFEGIWQ